MGSPDWISIRQGPTWRGGGPHDQGEVPRQKSPKPETSEGRVPIKKGIIGSMYSYIRGVAPGGEKDPLPQEKGDPQKISQMMGP